MQWKSSKEAVATSGGAGADDFAAAIRSNRLAMIITDPAEDDNPIVFVNDAFLQLTGYQRSEIIGRNCRFLQGDGTDPNAIGRIRAALRAQTDISLDILNYRKSGEPFWNALYISPVFDEAGKLQYFFSSQMDVTDRKDAEQLIFLEKDRIEQVVRERTADLRRRTAELEGALEAKTVLIHEVDHRVKNNLQMISSLILMQSRAIPDESIRNSLRTMLARVEALATVHRRLYQSEDVTRFDVGDFIRDLVGDLIAASGLNIESRLDLDGVKVPADSAAPLALMINEIVTNSLKHAFLGRDGGIIDVGVRQHDGGFRVEVCDDGSGIAGDGRPPEESDSFGLRLIRSIARQLKADVKWEAREPGTRVTIDVPLQHRPVAGANPGSA